VGIFSKAKKADPAMALRQTFGSQVAARLDANPAVQRIAMDTVQFYY
jgi:prolyl 4-hydroxylase